MDLCNFQIVCGNDVTADARPDLAAAISRPFAQLMTTPAMFSRVVMRPSSQNEATERIWMRQLCECHITSTSQITCDSTVQHCMHVSSRDQHSCLQAETEQSEALTRLLSDASCKEGRMSSHDGDQARGMRHSVTYAESRIMIADGTQLETKVVND